VTIDAHFGECHPEGAEIFLMTSPSAGFSFFWALNYRFFSIGLSNIKSTSSRAKDNLARGYPLPKSFNYL
jgi:hypothetical protein